MARSVGVSAVVRCVRDIYLSQLRVLLPAAAVLVGVARVGNLPSIAGSTVLALVASIGVLVVITIFAGLVVALVADVRRGGRKVTIGKLVRTVRPVFGQLILVGLVAEFALGVLFSLASLLFVAFLLGAALGFGASIGSVIGVGLIGILLGLAPGLLLLTNWSMAIPVVLIEHPGGLRALGRSRELVRGNRCRVFGVIVIVTALLGGGGYVIEMGAATLGSTSSSAVKVLLGIIAAPIPMLTVAVLYFELNAAPPSEVTG